MIAVLTGDIVASRRMPDKRQLLHRLQEIIEKRSGLPKTPRWGIFRGDGFQVELSTPADALRVAILIRSGIRSVLEFYNEGLDARIGIGIGAKGYVGKSINESDGEAYQSAGKVLDSLKTGIQVETSWKEFDTPVNISLSFADVLIREWTHAEAEIAWMSMSGNFTQIEMAKKLKISQPAVNKRINRAHLDELNALISYFYGEISARTKK
jgi:hypothetical protein